MPVRAKAIIPRKLLADPKKLARAIHNGMDAAAKGVEVDFNVTTQTWKHKPSFDTKKDGYNREVSTGDDVYNMLNKGADPYIIRPKRKRALSFATPYRAKSTPGVIGSKGGGTGNTFVVTKLVQHPGYQARKWDQAIRKKWEKKLTDIVQRAIDAEF